MAITTDQIDDGPNYTNAHMIKMIKQAIIAVTTGQSVSVMGRVHTRADLDKLMSALEFFEARENANEDGGGIVLVRFRKPS